MGMCFLVSKFAFLLFFFSPLKWKNVIKWNVKPPERKIVCEIIIADLLKVNLKNSFLVIIIMAIS